MLRLLFLLMTLAQAADIGQPAPGDAVPGQWTVVHVWASWCAPCLEELPKLQGLDAAFVIVSVDADVEAARGIWDSLDLELETAFDPEGLILERWGAHGLPSTWVVDPKGVLRWEHRGALNDAGLIELKRQLRGEGTPGKAGSGGADPKRRLTQSRIMQPAGGRMERAAREHVHGVREGAAGASDGEDAACGCN